MYHKRSRRLFSGSSFFRVNPSCSNPPESYMFPTIFRPILQSLAGMLVLCLVGTLHGQSNTPAGTRILNQSTATFRWFGRPFGVSSNVVENVVAPVYGVSITPDGTISQPGHTAFAEPGQSISFPYILFNTGNTIDSYDINLPFLPGPSTFEPVFRRIVLDSNGNGTLDPGEGGTSIGRVDNLAAGEFVYLLVIIEIPASTPTDREAYFDIQGTSINDPGKSDVSNVNRTLLINDAKLELKKRSDREEALPGDTVTYILSVLNTGNANALGENITVDSQTRTGIIIADEVPESDVGGTVYLAGSLTGNPGGQLKIFSIDNGVTWARASSASEEPDAESITDVAYLIEGELRPGQSASVEYNVLINPIRPPGNVANTARLIYRNQSNERITDEATNTVLVTVPPVVDTVFIGPKNEPRAVGGSDQNNDFTVDPGVGTGTQDNFQVAGNFITFNNTIENAATFTDVINVTLEPRAAVTRTAAGQSGGQARNATRADPPSLPPTTIPEEWTIQFLATDGIVALRDTNGDQIPDVGPLEPGEQYTIVVRVLVPNDWPTDDNDGAGFQAAIRASSGTNREAFNITVDIMPAIRAISGTWGDFSKQQFAPDIVKPGSPITYVIRFGHGLPFFATQALISDPINEFLTNVRDITTGSVQNLLGPDVVQVTGAFDSATQQINWSIPVVPPNFIGELSFTADVREGTPNGAILDNEASISSDQTRASSVSNSVGTVSGANSVLDVVKKANRDEVSVGDPVMYTVKIANLGPTAVINDTELVDTLPRGFRYINGSARVNGARIEPAISSDGSQLIWSLGDLALSDTKTVEYGVVLTPDAANSDGRNVASVTGLFPGGTAATIVDTAQVKIVPGPFNRKSLIIGRVYVDHNDNQIQDEGEPGIEGVRLYLDDGTYVLTDSSGQYHIVGVMPGIRTLRLDESTLPPDYTLEIIDVENAGNPASRFLDLKWGTMHKANFRVLPVKGHRPAESLHPGTPSTLNKINLIRDGAAASLELNWSGRVKPSYQLDEAAGAVIITLPGVGTSRQPAWVTIVDNTVETIHTAVDRDRSLCTVRINLLKHRGGYPHDFVRFDESESGLNIHLKEMAPAVKIASRKPAVVVAHTPDSQKPVIITPADNAEILARDRIAIKVACHVSAQYELFVNNVAVDKNLIGLKSMDIKKRLAIYEYVSVQLKPGINRIRFDAAGPTADSKGSARITVKRAAAPHTITVRTAPERIAADNRTAPTATVILNDENGLATGEATVITVKCDKGEIISPDLRPLERYHQAQIRDGKAILKLSPAAQPEVRKLTVSINDLEKEFDIVFQPELRDWIVVGSASGTASLQNSKKTGSGRTTERDEDWDGRVGVFAKGQLPGDITVTASYDSERGYDDQKIFREFDPDEFYPVYGDASTTGYDAQSRDQIYAKVEKGQSYVLYGDYATDLNESELAGNSRRFTGAKADIKSGYVDFKAFASNNDQAVVRLEIPGEGVSGFYQLPDRDVLVNSEEIILETRDRSRPEEVLTSQNLSRFSDYSIDYRFGRILFKRPIPSRDQDFNPVILVIRYEIDGARDRKYYTYGGRGAIHDKDRRLELGGSYLVEQHGPMDEIVQGIDTTLKITDTLTLRGEYATSDTLESGRDDGYTIELDKAADGASFALYYKDIGEKFDNPGMTGSTVGRSVLGLEGEYRLHEKLRLRGEIYTQRDDRSDRQQDAADIDFIYERRELKLTVGGGYIKERDTAGETKGEVRESPVARFGVGMPLTEKLSMEALHEQALADGDSENPTRTEIDLSWQFNPTTRMYAGIERRRTRKSGEDTNLVIGADTLYSEHLSYFNKYYIDDTVSGRSGRSNNGLHLSLPVNEELMVDFTGEISRTLEEAGATQSNDDFWAATSGFLYRPTDGEYTFSGRHEIRVEDDRTQHFNEIGGTLRMDEDNTLFARQRITFAEEKVSGDEWIVDLLLGWAYRPVSTDAFHLISDFEIDYESGTTDVGSSRLYDFILSSEFNWELSNRSVLEGKYAAKYTLADFVDENFFSDLKAARFKLGFTDRIYGAAGLRWLTEYESSTHELGYGVEMGVQVKDDFIIALGYNFEGFEDDDFARGNHWQDGVYVSFRLKFDEGIFGIVDQLRGTSNGN